MIFFASLAWFFSTSVLATDVVRNQPEATYTNPIISGFAPDPSCIRVDQQYFCVTSSFSAFPGVPVYTSRDLVQWEQIGNVLSRPEQLPAFNTLNDSTGGIWAATIRNHDNKFYVTTTFVLDGKPPNDTSRWDNLIFTNEDIWANDGNGWSNPIHFGFPGYDTSLFWDDDGKVYVQGSHYWRVFPAIQQFQIDLETGESLSGDPVTMWTGTGGLAPEGPHIYKKDGFYYLLIAEGGTGLNHMVTMARATSIQGPFTPCPYNPVLTNANTTEYLQTVGHADVFQDTNGNYWSAALATRNATVNFPMGRETVMVPVVWDKGEFPVFNGGKPGRAHIHMEGPLPSSKSPTPTPSNGILVGQNQSITFASGSTLPRQLVYFRLPDTSAFTVSPPSHPNTLRIIGSAENITGTTNGTIGTSTFVARRQDHVEFTASASLDFEPKVDGEEAGMTLFLQREQHFDLGVVALNGTRFIRLRTITANSTDEGQQDPISRPGIASLPSNANHLRLMVQAVNASTYQFSYRELGEADWHTVGFGAASQVSGGFTGTVVGMFATGNGRNSTTPAYFSDFEYGVNAHVF